MLHNPRQDAAEQTTQQQPIASHLASSTSPSNNSGQISKTARRSQRSELAKEAVNVVCNVALPPEPRIPKFVEVCVNTGKWHRSLGEINITDVYCDSDLFALIKQRYDEVRGHWTKFLFLEPAKVELVQYSLEERYQVGIMLHPMAVPPKDEVDKHNYEYAPCPLKPLPPVPDNVFMHLLNNPGPHRRPIWLHRLPKKMNHSLLNSGDELLTRWGLHIIEGPNWAAIWTAAFCLTFASGLFSILWFVFRNDVSGDFGIGSWLVSASTLGMMIYFSKWSQE
ncbi:hypothetical protein MMC34_002135 [Xylographa carneopallida]|nr:hypothetical protein [Xylographa carneopallida]